MTAITPILARYSLEILVLVGIAAAAVSLVRVPPRGRLIFWRIVVAACLLLPLAPPRILHVDLVTATEMNASLNALPSASTAADASTMSFVGLIPWIVLAGVLLRTAWLAVGIVRLRALTRRSEAAVLSQELRVLQQALAPGADVSWHDDLLQPVTFGMRRPVVLLPSRLRDASPDMQRAVVCHELVHVDRGDWLATILEELIQTALWFHPAIWWAIGQIQLNRETTVDARVVGITGSRRAYMEALLAFADAKGPALAPVFARRRQIVVRIRQLSQEVVMSRTRLTVAGITLAAIVIGSSWGVVSAVPMRTEVRYRAIGEPPLAPQPQAVLAPHTQVVKANPTPESRQAPAFRAVASLAQNPRVTPPPPPPPPPPPQPGSPRVVQEVKPVYPPDALGRGVGAVVTVEVTIAVTGDIVDAKAGKWRLTIDREINDPNYWASKPERAFLDEAEAAARKWKFAPLDKQSTVQVLFSFRDGSNPSPGGANSVTWNVIEDRTSASSTGALPVVRVGGNIKPPTKTHDARPAYPEGAKADHVEGVVILELRIGSDGSVVDAKVMRSIPMLDEAAVAAVRQWKYIPTLLNGAPVEVLMTVTVQFAL